MAPAATLAGAVLLAWHGSCPLLTSIFIVAFLCCFCPAFLPFTSAENALENINAVSEGQTTRRTTQLCLIHPAQCTATSSTSIAHPLIVLLPLLLLLVSSLSGEATQFLLDWLQLSLPKSSKKATFELGVLDSRLAAHIKDSLSVSVCLHSAHRRAAARRSPALHPLHQSAESVRPAPGSAGPVPRLLSLQGEVQRAPRRQHDHTGHSAAGPAGQGPEHVLHASARVVQLALPRTVRHRARRSAVRSVLSAHTEQGYADGTVHLGRIGRAAG